MFFLYYKLPHFEYIAVWIVAFGKIAKWYHFTNFLLKVTCFPTSIKISVLVWLTAKYVFLQREFHCETRFPTKQISPRNEFPRDGLEYPAKRVFSLTPTCPPTSQPRPSHPETNATIPKYKSPEPTPIHQPRTNNTPTF